MPRHRRGAPFSSSLEAIEHGLDVDRKVPPRLVARCRVDVGQLAVEHGHRNLFGRALRADDRPGFVQIVGARIQHRVVHVPVEADMDIRQSEIVARHQPRIGHQLDEHPALQPAPHRFDDDMALAVALRVPRRAMSLRRIAVDVHQRHPEAQRRRLAGLVEIDQDAVVAPIGLRGEGHVRSAIACVATFSPLRAVQHHVHFHPVGPAGFGVG